ncbi:hypothetical protein V8017_05590 [Stenotrophomonas rhizophila]
MALKSKRAIGPSVYYVTDKNIFDALNEHKVTSDLMVQLLADRNTIASSRERRVELASYFSRLTHDYFDNQKIANVLGVVPRRERMTSLFVEGSVLEDGVRVALEEVSKIYKELGDTFTISKHDKGYRALLQYSKVDYRRSEFNQVQQRDAEIDISIAVGGVEIRSHQNEYVDRVRDACVAALQRSNEDLKRRDISLIAFPEAKTRSRFFHDLFSDMPGFSFQQVTGVFIYKPREDGGEGEEREPSVDNVALKGSGVNSTRWFADFTDDGYYVVRVIWTSKEIFNEGNLYVIEALFADPETCSDFSFLLQGVHERLDAGHQPRRRAPTKSEVINITKAIESSSRRLMEALRASLLSNVG